MGDMWSTESVLKKHGLWRELAGPAAGPTAIKLQWQDMQIEKLRGLLARVIAEDDSNVDTATCLSYELTDEIRAALQVSEGSTSSPQP